jgi:hypothetical protein
MKTSWALWSVAWLTAFSLITINTAWAQPTNPAVWAGNSVFKNNPYALFVITNLLAEPEPELSVPTVSQTWSPPGTYWTLKNGGAPLPVDMFPDLPVYETGTNQYPYLTVPLGGGEYKAYPGGHSGGKLKFYGYPRTKRTGFNWNAAWYA